MKTARLSPRSDVSFGRKNVTQVMRLRDARKSRIRKKNRMNEGLDILVALDPMATCVRLRQMLAEMRRLGGEGVLVDLGGGLEREVKAKLAKARAKARAEGLDTRLF